MSAKAATALCCAISALLAAVASAASPMLVEITKTFSLDIVQSGVLIATNFAGFVLFVTASGLIVDRMGKKTVVSISLWGLAASLLLLSLAPCFALVCLSMLLVGGFLGVLESQISGLVADMNPRKADYFVNRTQVFFGLGAMAGPVLASLALSQGVAWQLCYRGIAALTLLMSAAVTRARFPHNRPTNRVRLRHMKRALQDRKFQLLCLCMVCYTGVEAGSWVWMCTFLTERQGFTLMRSALAAGVFWGAMTLGRSVCGRLSLRYPLRRLITGLSLLSGVTVLLYGLVIQEASVWVMIALSGLFFASLWPLLVSYGIRSFDGFSGMTASLLVGFGGVGATLIPIAIGFIARQAGLRIAMSSPSILLFAVAVLFTRLDKLQAGALSRSEAKRSNDAYVPNSCGSRQA